MNNLKILLVLEAVGGGTGRHVIDLARELRDLGNHVHLIWSPTRIERAFDQDLAALEGVTKFSIPMRRSPHPSDLRALMALRKYIRAQGMRTTTAVRNASKRKLPFWRLIPKSARSVRGLRQSAKPMAGRFISFAIRPMIAVCGA